LLAALPDVSAEYRCRDTENPLILFGEDNNPFPQFDIGNPMHKRMCFDTIPVNPAHCCANQCCACSRKWVVNPIARFDIELVEGDINKFM